MIALPFAPGGMNHSTAEIYVGGKTAFAALREAFPELMRPFYSTRKAKFYRRESLDAAIAAAERAELKTASA